MTRIVRAAFILASLAATFFACSSKDTSGGGGSSSSSSASGMGGDPTPENSCVRRGDHGNEKGVGEYCTPFGNECLNFAEAGLCLAAVGQDQWMCTRLGCDATTDCGKGAGCVIVQGQGSACVPCRCDDSGIGCSDAGAPDGGGGDASGDAGADAGDGG